MYKFPVISVPSLTMMFENEGNLQCLNADFEILSSSNVFCWVDMTVLF